MLGENPEIELHVKFSSEEMELTRRLSLDWYRALPEADKPRDFHEPHTPVPSMVARLRRAGQGTPELFYLEPGQEPRGESDRTKMRRAAFTGRAYQWRRIRRTRELGLYEALYRLPGCFWFDQYRTIAADTMLTYKTGDADAGERRLERVGGRSYDEGWAELNRRLLDMKTVGPTTGQYSRLAKAFERVFPGKSFAEPRPEWRTDRPLFQLYDGANHYSLPEMSGGEQQILPLLVAFQEHRVGSSVVLIDEVDLHLHPSMAQALFTALLDLAPDCQFIVTTHSSAILDVCDPDHVHRLGSVPWL